MRGKRLVGEAKSTTVGVRVEYWVFKREKLIVRGWSGWKTLWTCKRGLRKLLDWRYIKDSWFSKKFQVRGVVFDVLDTYTLYCALVVETACLSPAFLHCSIGFLGFFPETAWRFDPYRQAAHQRWASVLVLA